ncbi:MAG: NAD(P)-dependent glycerol-3-phosphate dehydrogenase [Rhodobiaceae bacterium]|nr:NAD(P)-dependent glycerol-3-phosphate dehydrogenase [Rhodobiaceae bacterium]
MTEIFKRFSVLGAGAWGTALAMLLAGKGRDVSLWTHSAESAQSIARTGENRRLPGVRLNPGIRPTADLALAADADAVLIVVPAQSVRAVARTMREHVRTGTPLIICSKGIERGSLALLSDVVAAEVPDARVAVLSGPSFAADVVRGLPTAVTLAATDMALAESLTAAIGETHFRPYASDDIAGVETGGSVKNVLAIACGIVSGRSLGASAGAALIARGFAEMTRLGIALGGRAETLAGLSGLGDLVLTCTSAQSRNFALGADLGAGHGIDAALAARGAISEGAFTAEAVAGLAARHGIEMPICGAIHDIVSGASGVEEAIRQLLARPFRSEGL